MRRVCGMKVARITLGDLPICLCATGIARCREGLAEVSRSHSSRCDRTDEGRNMKQWQEP
jgi:hypothetical protein